MVLPSRANVRNARTVRGVSLRPQWGTFNSPSVVPQAQYRAFAAHSSTFAVSYGSLTIHYRPLRPSLPAAYIDD